MPPPLYTYRALLDGEQYLLIKFISWSLYLDQANKRPTHCCECANKFSVGECIRHIQHQHNCYVCLPCAKNLILKYGANGFRINPLQNIQVCDSASPQYTSQQIADSIQKFAFTITPENLTDPRNL